MCTGKLPLSVSALSPRCKDLHRRVRTFITENVLPFEREYLLWSADPKTKWTVHPKLEQLKVSLSQLGNQCFMVYRHCKKIDMTCLSPGPVLNAAVLQLRVYLRCMVV